MAEEIKQTYFEYPAEEVEPQIDDAESTRIGSATQGTRRVQAQVVKFMKEHSQTQLLDKMKALGLTKEDIETLQRLPVTASALNDIVETLICEHCDSQCG